MKYLLSLFAALTISLGAVGQVTITSAYTCPTYTLTASVIGITPTDIGLYSDDSYSGVLTIGFPFTYYGASHTQFIVGENGNIDFDLTLAAGYDPWPISAPLLGNPSMHNSICGPWCDILGTVSRRPIYYSLQGTAPNRTMAITWCGVYMFSCTTQWVTTQIILYETSNVIETHVEHKTICAGWNGGYAIIGVENATGSAATVAPGRDYPSVYNCTNEAWRFTPAGGGTSYTVASIPFAPIPYATSTIYWYDSTTHAYLGSGPTLIVTPTVPTTYEAAALGCNDTTRAFLHIIPHPCTNVVSNNPCWGDSITMDMTGDSTGATYFWRGPAGFTSTLQNPFIFPATYANTGAYYVVKTRLGIRDTDSTYIVVHHKPIMTLSSNSPLCSGMLDTLHLLLTPDSASIFSWVGPSGFTSTILNPEVDNFTAPNAGTYTAYGVTPFGCKDTVSTNVSIVPPPPPPGISGVPAYCYGATFIPPTVTGTGILWYPSATSTTGTPISPWRQTPPWIRTDSPGNYTIYATQTYGCLSPKDSFKIKVYPRINPAFTFSVTLGCDSDVVYLANTSTNANRYMWHFGDLTTDTSLGFSSPIRHSFVAPHTIHSITLTASNPLCSNDTTLYPDARHEVKALFSPVPPVLCLGQTTILTDSSYSTQGSGAVPMVSHQWSFGDGTTDNTNGTPPAHMYAQPGIYPVHLQVTDAVSCIDTISKNVVVLKVTIKNLRDTSLCIRNPFQINNDVSIYPNINLSDFAFTWTPISHLDDSTAQKPFFTGFGKVDFTFMATEKTYGCADTGHVTVNSMLGAKLLNLTADQVIPYGNNIQLNADNEVIYWWTPDNGTLSNPNINNPVAAPTRTTLYTVYGYDINGCLDSAFINITVDSNMAQSVPTAFSPNGDGKNDVFRPVGLKYQNMVEMRVFNRWGQQVFYSNNVKNGWDGTFNGEPQDMGTYYYTIIVARPGGDGENVTYKGELTLIR